MILTEKEILEIVEKYKRRFPNLFVFYSHSNMIDYKK